jgi:hypothetical protein
MNRIAHIFSVIIITTLLVACEEGRQLPQRSDNSLLDCPMDTKDCPDGSIVSRDPTQNCRFASCPELNCLDDKECMPDFSAAK